MGYFVTVTFDLKHADQSPYGKNVYSKISDALDAIDYSKVVTGKKAKTLHLPSNTYVAEFESEVDDRDIVIDLVRTEIKGIFSKYSVTGKYFISTGKDWKWSAGTF